MLLYANASYLTSHLFSSRKVLLSSILSIVINLSKAFSAFKMADRVKNPLKKAAKVLLKSWRILPDKT